MWVGGRAYVNGITRNYEMEHVVTLALNAMSSVPGGVACLRVAVAGRDARDGRGGVRTLARVVVEELTAANVRDTGAAFEFMFNVVRWATMDGRGGNRNASTARALLFTPAETEGLLRWTQDVAKTCFRRREVARARVAEEDAASSSTSARGSMVAVSMDDDEAKEAEKVDHDLLDAFADMAANDGTPPTPWTSWVRPVLPVVMLSPPVAIDADIVRDMRTLWRVCDAIEEVRDRATTTTSTTTTALIRDADLVRRTYYARSHASSPVYAVADVVVEFDDVDGGEFVELPHARVWRYVQRNLAAMFTDVVVDALTRSLHTFAYAENVVSNAQQLDARVVDEVRYVVMRKREIFRAALSVTMGMAHADEPRGRAFMYIQEAYANERARIRANDGGYNEFGVPLPERDLRLRIMYFEREVAAWDFRTYVRATNATTAMRAFHHRAWLYSRVVDRVRKLYVRPPTSYVSFSPRSSRDVLLEPVTPTQRELDACVKLAEFIEKYGHGHDHARVECGHSNDGGGDGDGKVENFVMRVMERACRVVARAREHDDDDAWTPYERAAVMDALEAATMYRVAYASRPGKCNAEFYEALGNELPVFMVDFSPSEL